MGVRILVVDDEPPMLRVVAANLRARGFEVLTAASGEDALLEAAEHRPDCILLDLNLPGIDGLEVLRRLRTWASTPVVIMSALDGGRARTAALGLGADDYVAKPFAMADLVASVRGALGPG
jgi:two-component system, OmpR family, KDP operon response regulator KdpE